MQLTLSLLSLILCTTLAAQDPGTSYLFQVPNPVPPDLRATLHQSFDILHGETADDGSMQVVVLPEELAAFKTLVPNALLVQRGRPFADIYREMLQRMPEPPDPLYYTTAEIEAEITSLMNAYPALALKVDVNSMTGTPLTHNGNTIWALKVSDNVAQDQDEPAIVIIAQHHARELNGPHMVIGAMRRVLSGYATDPQIKATVDAHELYFVPTVNVDGVDHVWCCDNFWRKNRRNNGNGTFGVDLNRNYPTLWGVCGSSSQTSSQTYRSLST